MEEENLLLKTPHALVTDLEKSSWHYDESFLLANSLSGVLEVLYRLPIVLLSSGPWVLDY